MRFGWMDTFQCDLSERERQLCTWVAERASAGRRRAYYVEARHVLGIDNERELTDLLRGIRERMDDIHDLVQSPIVNTSTPYFDIHPDADHIWDSYRRVESDIGCLSDRQLVVTGAMTSC